MPHQVTQQFRPFNTENKKVHNLTPQNFSKN
jgi:hypothetical protein